MNHVTLENGAHPRRWSINVTRREHREISSEADNELLNWRTKGFLHPPRGKVRIAFTEKWKRISDFAASASIAFIDGWLAAVCKQFHWSGRWISNQSAASTACLRYAHSNWDALSKATWRHSPFPLIPVVPTCTSHWRAFRLGKPIYWFQHSAGGLMEELWNFKHLNAFSRKSSSTSTATSRAN